jgi:multidrug efflux pump subunit AcrA (membrane-fusion protein)
MADATPVLRLTEPPRFIRRVGWTMAFLCIGIPLVLAFVPWRQTVYGDGMVIAFHPYNRPYTIEAPIHGRVTEFMVEEGSRVRKGQQIAHLEDLDELLTETLSQQQRDAQNKLEYSELGVERYSATVTQLEGVLLQSVLEQEALIGAYERDVEEAEDKIDELAAQVMSDESTYNITANLARQGLESREKYILDQQKLAVTREKLSQAEKAMESKKQGLASSKAKLDAIRSKLGADVAKAQAEYEAARAKVQAEQIDLNEKAIKLRRQQTQDVTSPTDGVVLRLHQNLDAGAQISVGAPLVTIVPDTQPEEMAAELYMPGRDIPLVKVGDPVRLMFDGWPAVQFIGWPSIAVGTFPGKVALVDRTQTKAGKFRILVVPDPSQLKNADPDRLANELRAPTGWPNEQYLRQGAAAKGWVLLSEVPLGFELWRRMNGFQPVITDVLPADKEKDGAGTASEPGPKESKPKLKRPK